MLVMAEKPIGAATGYPHLYSIAAERPGLPASCPPRKKDLENRRCLPDNSSVGFGVGHP